MPSQPRGFTGPSNPHAPDAQGFPASNTYPSTHWSGFAPPYMTLQWPSCAAPSNPSFVSYGDQTSGTQGPSTTPAGTQRRYHRTGGTYEPSSLRLVKNGRPTMYRSSTEPMPNMKADRASFPTQVPIMIGSAGSTEDLRTHWESPSPAHAPTHQLRHLVRLRRQTL